jgi:TonB family protein
MRWLLVAVFLSVTSLPAQDYRAWLRQGVEAYKNARYVEAIDAFQKAAELNANEITPRLYLGMSWFVQYIPGSDSTENLEYARKSEDEFTKALKLDPNNVVCLPSLASLSFNQHKWDEATSWNEKVIAIEPRNKEAYYTLGVIAWSQFYPKYGEARGQLAMRPETPGPLTSPTVRDELRATYSSVIEAGISNLEKALEIDPDYDDAMAYLNLLIRERGDLRDTAEECRRDVAVADEWVRKVLETKRRKAQEGSIGDTSVTSPSDLANAHDGGGSRIIRVGAEAQQANLVSKVDPAYPPLAREARIQGTVRFRITIGKDGSVTSVQLVSGHPLVVQAARDAVTQWKYEPTLLNGEPVDVLTTVEVNFSFTDQH